MRVPILAALVAAGLAAPGFAQDVAELVCAEYASMDNAGKMAIVAELESLNSESASSQELTSVEIEQTLATQCTESPDMLIIDVFKE